MVEASVNPVDAEIGKEDEYRELQVVVEREWSVIKPVVEFGIALYFQGEEASCQQSHTRHGRHSLLDLHGHLILEVFRVVEGGLIEHEDIGEGSADEVEDDTEEPRPLASRLLLSNGMLTM